MASAPKQEWLVILPDNAGAYQKRMEVRPNHLENIKTNVAAGKLVLGGASLDEPIKDGQPPRINGSAMLLCTDTEEEAMEIVKGDLYYTNNVWDKSKIQIFPFRSAIRTGL